MKRAFAWMAYSAGAVMAASAVVDSGFIGILFGLAWWWIGAGIGIRLGMEPYEFADGIKNVLGLDRPANDNHDHDATL